MAKQTPFLNEYSPEQKAEWDTIADLLIKNGRITEAVYPDIPSVRRNPKDSLAKAIDHTLLKQGATREDFQKLYTDARTWDVWSVCVPSNRVAQAAEALGGSSVLVCTVVGFPFGYENTAGTVQDTRTAIQHGAKEIDMVIPLGYLKDGDYLGVFDHISAVVQTAEEVGTRLGTGVLVKVILETSELSDLEILKGSAISCFAGAHFIKTSTGFASGGATLEALKIMRITAGEHRGVKASGGVRTREFALQCLSLGTDRIGASSTAAILGVDNGAVSSSY